MTLGGGVRGRRSTRTRPGGATAVLHADATRLSNPPVALTSFVGRVQELAALRDLVCARRLLTLTGAGGCGKSRLAAQVAAEVSGQFPDGVFWVELAPVSDGRFVATSLAQLLGLRPPPGQEPAGAVVARLAGARALLVLDNCEHVLQHAALAAESVARGCPEVRVLATSREPLLAEGETEWRVPPLSLPDHAMEQGGDTPDAIQLFIERAAQVRPGFSLTPENAPVIGAICHQLDGIPLAIELASTRLRAFSLEQIAAGLGDSLRLLNSGTRTGMPRHQTLRASVDWSHELLSGRERAVFRRLGVFVDGFTVQAAEDVCAGDGVPRTDVIGVLAALVEKSLVQAEERGAAVRYRLLEVIRQYAVERLQESGESDWVRVRHHDFYLGFAESVAPELLTPAQPKFLDLLDSEGANFAAAIEHAAETDPDKALRLTLALTFWWRLRSLFPQGEAAFARALDAAPEPSVPRARALWGRATLLTRAGKWAEALPASLRALEAAEAVGDHSTVARALWPIGLAEMQHDPIGARSPLERSRSLASGGGDEFAYMQATQALGMSYSQQDDNARARPLLDEALGLAERLGQHDTLAWHWAFIAIGAWVRGDLAIAVDAGERSLAVAKQVGDIVIESTADAILGFPDIEAGHPQRALERLAAVRERSLTYGIPLIVPACEWAIGVAHAADGRLEDARIALQQLVDGGATGWAWTLARAHVVLAEVLRLLGDAGAARCSATAACAVARRAGNQPLLAEANLVLGRLAAGAGEWLEAQRLQHDALLVAVERGTPRLPRAFEALAEVAVGLEGWTEAARLLGAAERQWGELGMVSWPAQRAEMDALGVRVRDALGVAAFDRAQAEGRSLTASEAVAYVRRARGGRKRPSFGWASLTTTELDVARHAASGLTNAEIATRMFISSGTVRTHLSHIFTKLGLKNRAELAREVTRRKEVPDEF